MHLVVARVTPPPIALQGCRVHLLAGQLLWFVGSVWHRGGAFDHDNFRIHLHLDSNEMPPGRKTPVENHTTLIRGATVEEELQGGVWGKGEVAHSVDGGAAQMAASVEQGGSAHQAVPDDAVDLSDGLLEERDFWSDGEGFSKVARERAFTRTLLIDLVPPEPIKSELAGDHGRELTIFLLARPVRGASLQSDIGVWRPKTSRELTVCQFEWILTQTCSGSYFQVLR